MNVVAMIGYLLWFAVGFVPGFLVGQHKGMVAGMLVGFLAFISVIFVVSHIAWIYRLRRKKRGSPNP